MSFILDALRKSENARLRQEHPAMFDARPVPARRRFPAWFLALGVLLGLNLLVLLYVLLREERAAAVPPVPAAAAPAVSAVVSAPTSPPVVVERAPLMTPVPATSAGPFPASTAAPPPVTAASPVPVRTTNTIASTTATPPARTRDDLVAAGGAVPEAQISLHVYDADPAKRFVFLNGQRLREGDIAPDGLRVRRIDADGVVLDYRGDDFKVPLEP